MRDDIRARRENAAIERIQNALRQEIKLPANANRATPQERKAFLLEGIADAVEGSEAAGGDLSQAVEAIKNASEDELVKLEGIGKAKAKKLKEGAE